MRVTKSVRLPRELAEALARTAKHLQCTESAVIQRAVGEYCRRVLATHPGTLYEQAEGLLGGWDGPADLTENARRYLNEAIRGKEARRAARRRDAS